MSALYVEAIKELAERLKVIEKNWPTYAAR